MSGPSILLIGGVPGCGKTTLAGCLARRLSINLVLGGDLLREFARGIVPEDEHSALFEHVYDCWRLTKAERPTSTSVVQGFEMQGALMNRGVRRVLQRGLDDGESMVLEYIHLLPDQLGDLARGAEVFPLLLVAEDPKVHEDRLRNRGVDTHVRSRPQRLIDHLQEYRWMQERLIASARGAGIPVFPVDREPPEALADRVADQIRRGK